MSILTKARKLSLIASNPHIVTCTTKYLFILSHMRSRSSVIAHVLGSNPGICGYSELHSAYIDRLDLLDMRAQLYQDARCRLSNKYLLDKLLHNHCVISDEVLAMAQPKIVFLLREPDSTIKSIMNMGYRTGEAWYKDPFKVLQYYCSRLATLEKYARRVGDGYFYLNADDLVNHTDAVLHRLSRWLDLDVPLDRHYTNFPNTGKRHYGDSSDNIKAGVIKKTEAHVDVKVPAHVLQMAETAYYRCRKQLILGSRLGGWTKRTA
ncbi:MAG: sulfotransferase [Cellvibrionaceae bacterium]